MKRFGYRYHTVGDEYPESSQVIKFGKGYSFASKPRGPDQIIFHLEVQGLCWWTNVLNVIDRTTFPNTNAAHLQDFYEFHRLYEPFEYVHPSRGLVTVRFSKPLPAFRGIKAAIVERPDLGRRGHAIEPVQIDLVLLP
jgi:hypothetical protein